MSNQWAKQWSETTTRTTTTPPAVNGATTKISVSIDNSIQFDQKSGLTLFKPIIMVV